MQPGIQYQSVLLFVCAVFSFHLFWSTAAFGQKPADGAKAS